MGGPNNLKEVEVFLENMFADPNILTMKSNILRKFIGTMITFFRTEAAQDIYSQLGGKSPIVGHTTKLVSALQKELPDVVIDFAMRYTPPFSDEVVERLKEQDVEKVYLIPLYPQFSTTTTKSSLEDFEEALHVSDMDAILVETKHFFENEKYNQTVLERIKETMNGDEYKDYDIIFSAHGLPQKIVDAGDPYQRHVERQVEYIKEMMLEKGMDFHQVHLAYQSKVGPMAWLKPSLEEKLDLVRNRGVVIYPIAFTIDNSETDFELDIEYREIAQKMGFVNYKVCKCPNDHPLFVSTLKDIYEKMR
jgi:ferrochelatase